MFGSSLDLFEALFFHNPTAPPEDAYGNAGAGNIGEYQQLAASTHSFDPNSEFHSFPQDHANYFPSYESEDDFSYRFQIEDLYSKESYEEEEQLYGHYENWPINHDLLRSNCWEEYYISLGDNTSENTFVNALQDSQDFCLNEHGYASRYEDVENQSRSGFVSSGFESWFGHQSKEHCPDYDLQQPTNSVANLELCECIFGYWPCMSKHDPQMMCDSA